MNQHDDRSKWTKIGQFRNPWYGHFYYIHFKSDILEEKSAVASVNFGKAYSTRQIGYDTSSGPRPIQGTVYTGAFPNLRYETTSYDRINDVDIQLLETPLTVGSSIHPHLINRKIPALTAFQTKGVLAVFCWRNRLSDTRYEEFDQLMAHWAYSRLIQARREGNQSDLGFTIVASKYYSDSCYWKKVSPYSNGSSYSITKSKLQGCIVPHCQMNLG